MARSNNSFITKQKANQNAKKSKDKLEERMERKDQPSSGKLEDMIAYVDEFGNICDTPPEILIPEKSKPKDLKSQ